MTLRRVYAPSSPGAMSHMRVLLKRILRATGHDVLVVTGLGLLSSLVLWAVTSGQLDKFIFFKETLQLAEACYGAGQQCTMLLLESLRKLLPVFLCALAFAHAFKAGYFCVGLDGQLAIGVITFGLIALASTRGHHSHLVIFVLMVLGFLPVYLWGDVIYRLSKHSLETAVIVNLLSNLLAIPLVSAVLNSTRMQAVEQQSIATPRVFDGLLHHGINPWATVVLLVAVLAIAVAVASTLLNFTRFGVWARAAKSSPSAAAVAGIEGPPNQHVVVGSCLIIVAFASLFVFGFSGRGSVEDVKGMGFDAIMVAILGRYSPLPMLIYAVFLVLLKNVGVAIQIGIGTRPEMIQMVLGIVVLAMLVVRRRQA